MFKDCHKLLSITAIGIVMFGIMITGCSQIENNEPSLSKGSIQEAGTTSVKDIAGDDRNAISPDTAISNGSNDVQGKIEVEINRQEPENANTDSPINAEIDWEALEASYNPPT